MPTLVDSIEIGGVGLKNRLGFAPVNTGLLKGWPETGDMARAFYQQYFDAGLGLVYLGGLAVSDQGRANSSSLVLSATHPADDVSTVARKAREVGTKTVFQLEHAGRQAHPEEIGAEIVAPTAMACPVVGHVPRELTVSDIADIVHQFAKSAAVAQSAGADFVEIHAAHGYLISSFLSPHTNHRNDEYGGNVLNRFRFLDEVIEETAARLAIPMGVRINCVDNVPDGLCEEDLLWGLRQISDRISFVSVSGGMYSPYEDVIIPDMDRGPAIWRKHAKGLKGAVNLPVFLGGNISTVEMANTLLEEGSADVVLMARELLADPDVLGRLRSRDTVDGRCLRCNECKYHSRGKSHIDCPLNPVLSQQL